MENREILINLINSYVVDLSYPYRAWLQRKIGFDRLKYCALKALDSDLSWSEAHICYLFARLLDTKTYDPNCDIVLNYQSYISSLIHYKRQVKQLKKIKAKYKKIEGYKDFHGNKILKFRMEYFNNK